MKFSVRTILAVVAATTLSTTASAAAAAAHTPEIAIDSTLGQNLLTHARRLQEGNDDNNNAVDFNWVAGYEAKFQGCTHIKQWNGEADEDQDVRLETQRLIRFRLCPKETCSANKAAGCKSGYGDYIVDMSTFMNAYAEATKKQREYDCEMFLQDTCDCEDSDDRDDGFNAEYCEYDCYLENDMNDCVDRNPYDDEEEGQEFNLEEYMECKQLELPQEDDDNNEGRRRLQDGAEEEAEVAYYVGPYCAQQGGSVFMGLFSDDTCTTFVSSSDTTFETLMGFELPYAETSVVGNDCLSCIEQENAEDQNANDQADADQVSESCEQIYSAAGKCEAKLSYGVVDEVNNNACTYMEGIRIVRSDGLIDSGSSRPSAVATAFIVIFAMAFAAMAFYVWYLRTRLGVKKDALL